MTKSLAFLIGASLLIGGSASAQTCTQCGDAPPPIPTPIVVCTVKGNAGVGNKGEQVSVSEYLDCDPGKSGLHNQAWKNSDKPKSNR